MSAKRFILSALLIGLCLSSSAISAAVSSNPLAISGENQIIFMKAKEAYDHRKELDLVESLQQLQARNYVLAPYADYWLMLLRLNQADTATVREFLGRYSDTPFSDRLRGEWLKILAKRQDWVTFMEEYPKYKRDDVAVTCYAIEGRAESGDAAVLQEGLPLWLTPTEQPGNCGNLFDRMQKANVLTQQAMWARLRLALQENKISLAKSILERLNKDDAPILKLLDKASANPQQLLDKKLANAKTPIGQAILLYAIERMLKTNPEYALTTWRNVQSNFVQEDQDYAWGRIALSAARRHDPEALPYFAQMKSGVSLLDKDQLAWKTRAALLVPDWKLVQDTILAMTTVQQEEPAWRYWLARAYKAQQQIPAANALLVPLSRERSFYGLLAEEEIGDSIGGVPSSYKPSEQDVSALANIPGIQRAVELQLLEMRWESKAEWVYATKDMDDRTLLAAADFAAKQSWFDLAILTADKTKFMHDYSLRYPTPYRQQMQASARDQAVDEAWVYGITRQESRFMYYAKSGVGASGLMQLMPATAVWAAKKLGLADYRNDRIHELETNIQLGTYYLRYTLDLMGGQVVMATAAYNAGPSRAKRWAGTKPIEGAIYAEAIPFAETRQYVQKVMANAHFYATRLGNKAQSLKRRLGVIGPTSAVPVMDDMDKPELVDK